MMSPCLDCIEPFTKAVKAEIHCSHDCGIGLTAAVI